MKALGSRLHGRLALVDYMYNMADLAPCFVRPPYIEKVFLTHCIGIPQLFTVMNNHNINVYPDSISCQYKESFIYNRTLASTGRGGWGVLL